MAEQTREELEKEIAELELLTLQQRRNKLKEAAASKEFTAQANVDARSLKSKPEDGVDIDSINAVSMADPVFARRVATEIRKALNGYERISQ
jgi:hypothetical protein